MPTRYMKFLEAGLVELDIDQDQALAHLHLQGAEIDPTVLTIPLAQLGRLYRRISELLDKQPELFARPSRRKVQP